MKIDINFALSFSISNESKKISKKVKFRYLYSIEVRNHDIYVWNIFHFERFEKSLKIEILQVT